MKTTTTWKQHHVFETDQEGNRAHLDGDKKAGFSPKALLLSGLAACSGIDLVDILGKMKVEFSELEIDAEADQTEEHPRVFKDIHVTYSLKTDPANEEKVNKAIVLSLTKYCGVAAMLRKNSEIHHHIVIR